ncbi:Tfp pilus assembly protein FimT/FimU [Pseudoduganella sp. UC29_106]|uniref:pilus assembly FimT family protein n=1 Tax=Pseudoduganella sp. UC29_106 TaxID=3374553 RepID=UPI0037563F07
MRTTDPDQHRPARRHRPRHQLLALSAVRTGCRRAGGVSLIELMIVLAVASIMLSSALPSMRQAIEALQLKAASGDFVAAIHETRAQALAQGQIVTLLPNNGDWKQGWTLLIDANANRRSDPASLFCAATAPCQKAWKCASGSPTKRCLPTLLIILLDAAVAPPMPRLPISAP